MKLLIDQPQAGDCAAVYELVSQCPPLDINSRYLYALQCSDFADSCILARAGDGLVGWVSGHRLPADESVLFIWQVAVRADARGQRLGPRLVQGLLDRQSNIQVRTLHATVTADNGPSRAMFQRIAQQLDAPISTRPWFDRDKHFAGRHDSELLLHIGPFERARAAATHDRNTLREFARTP
ncbi:MAG: diaminobutyrate acetyltransferase [Steroidobacteraceae bacterium]